MPDYVSRYKDSSIHIFSYILVLYTYIYPFIFLSLNQSIYPPIYLSIYIYKDIYIYLSIYQPMFSQLWIRINVVHRFHVNAWRAVGKAFHALFLSHVHLSRSLACIAFKTHLQALIQISHWLWNFWKTSHIEILRQPTSILSLEETSADEFQSSLSATTFEDPWSDRVLPTLAFSPFELSLFFSVNSNWSATRISSGDLEDADAAAAGEVCEAERVDTVKDCTHASSSFQNSVKSNGAGTADERGARSSVKECTHASSSSQNSFRSKGGKTEVEDKATPTAAESVGRANALLEAKAPAGSEFLRMLVQKHHQKDKRNGGIKFNIILSSFSNLTTGPDQLFHHVILFSPKIAHLHNAMWRGVVGSRTTYDILPILNGIRRNFKARRSPGVHIRRI